MSNKKPPLGIIPDQLWREQRAAALVEAMARQLLNLSMGDAEDSEAARDMIDKWAREIVALNLVRAATF
jgi:hypothetical protein